MTLPFDPEWDSERRKRLAELEAKRVDPVAILWKQRALKERVERGEMADDVGRGHDPEPDHGG